MSPNSIKISEVKVEARRSKDTANTSTSTSTSDTAMQPDTAIDQGHSSDDEFDVASVFSGSSCSDIDSDSQKGKQSMSESVNMHMQFDQFQGGRLTDLVGDLEAQQQQQEFGKGNGNCNIKLQGDERFEERETESLLKNQAAVGVDQSQSENINKPASVNDKANNNKSKPISCAPKFIVIIAVSALLMIVGVLFLVCWCCCGCSLCCEGDANSDQTTTQAPQQQGRSNDQAADQNQVKQNHPSRTMNPRGANSLPSAGTQKAINTLGSYQKPQQKPKSVLQKAKLTTSTNKFQFSKEGKSKRMTFRTGTNTKDPRKFRSQAQKQALFQQGDGVSNGKRIKTTGVRGAVGEPQPQDGCNINIKPQSKTDCDSKAKNKIQQENRQTQSQESQFSDSDSDPDGDNDDDPTIKQEQLDGDPPSKTKTQSKQQEKKHESQSEAEAGQPELKPEMETVVPVEQKTLNERILKALERVFEDKKKEEQEYIESQIKGKVEEDKDKDTESDNDTDSDTIDTIPCGYTLRRRKRKQIQEKKEKIMQEFGHDIQRVVEFQEKEIKLNFKLSLAILDSDCDYIEKIKRNNNIKINWVPQILDKKDEAHYITRAFLSTTLQGPSFRTTSNNKDYLKFLGYSIYLGIPSHSLTLTLAAEKFQQREFGQIKWMFIDILEALYNQAFVNHLEWCFFVLAQKKKAKSGVEWYAKAKQSVTNELTRRQNHFAKQRHNAIAKKNQEELNKIKQQQTKLQMKTKRYLLFLECPEVILLALQTIQLGLDGPENRQILLVEYRSKMEKQFGTTILNEKTKQQILEYFKVEKVVSISAQHFRKNLVEPFEPYSPPDSDLTQKQVKVKVAQPLHIQSPRNQLQSSDKPILEEFKGLKLWEKNFHTWFTKNLENQNGDNNMTLNGVDYDYLEYLDQQTQNKSDSIS